MQKKSRRGKLKNRWLNMNRAGIIEEDVGNRIKWKLRKNQNS